MKSEFLGSRPRSRELAPLPAFFSGAVAGSVSLESFLFKTIWAKILIRVITMLYAFGAVCQRACR